MIRIPEGSTPDVKNKSFRISAEVDIPKGGAEGVLATQGGRFAGWALLVLEGKPAFAYAIGNQDGTLYQNQARQKTRFVGKEILAPGKHIIAFEFHYDGGGIGKGGNGTLSVDGKAVAEGKLEVTVPIRFSLDESFDVGMDTGSPVIDEYDSKMPFKFTGTLHKFEIELGEDQLTADKQSELERRKSELAMRTQ
jgi:arylsulfatase